MAARHELRTAGKAAKIVLAADRTRLANGWDDVAFVTAGVVDADGVMVPGAAPLVTFRVTGPDAIVAGDNADNAGHEPFQASERHAFEGWCLAILKAMAAGRVTVTASVAGLAASSITIEAGER